jgi:GNAT superfamily N-acetyltransferase
MILSKSEFAPLLPEFVRLSEACFGTPIPDAFWRWRYLDQADDYLAMNVHTDDGSVVANYSASGLLLSWRGQEHRALLSMSTMTHPSYAGRGLFTTLADELYRAAGERGYAAVLGFPNENSHAGFVSRLKWSDVYEIPTLHLGQAGLRVDRGECTLVASRRFEGEIREPSWLDELIHVKRTADHLNWRFADHPSNDYSMWVLGEAPHHGYAVTKRYETELDVVEFLAGDAQEAGELLRNIVAHAKAIGVTGINTWLPMHCPYRAVFEKLGFINRAPVTYFGGRGLLDPLAFTGIPADFRTFRNWFVQMGDSDVY